MENELKSVKVNCNFCGKEIECPEDMLEKAEKHMCFDCFQGTDNKETIDASKVHVDIPIDKFNEFIPETMTNSIVEDVFPEIWKERKQELKEMSKRELAEEMFGAGAYIAIKSFIESMSEEAKKEKDMKKEDAKKE